ncbi:MAG: SAM-dependent methyltransferase [Verrucomicrobiota bacterium]
MADLRSFLQAQFAVAGGSLPFERYMELALYDPDFGYYGHHIKSVGGERADFATSATLSGGLSRAIARWIEQRSDDLSALVPQGKVPVIEVGPGSGELAEGILRALGWRGRRRIDYHVVEVSAPLARAQRERLGRRLAGSHQSLEQALDVCQGSSLIISNELIDAFPARLFRWSESLADFEEVWIEWSESGGLREVFHSISDSADLRQIPRFRSNDWREGDRIELQSSVDRWLRSWTPHWRAGAMLTIDYGSEEDADFRRGSLGTLRAYSRHQRITGGGVYAQFGKRDLTVDVHFGDLVRWGEACRLRTVSLRSQRRFLSDYGESADVMARDGVGDAFLVLDVLRQK